MAKSGVSIKIEVSGNGLDSQYTVDLSEVQVAEFHLILAAARQAAHFKTNAATSLSGMVSIGLDHVFEIYVKDRVRSARAMALEFVGKTAP